MGEPEAGPALGTKPPGAEADHDLAALRTLLVGPEQHQIATLRSRLEDPDQRAADLLEVLPQVLLQHAHDPHLVRALTPPLEDAITSSVQRNPQPLADALFPVMGPAIRKAVAAGLAGMVESLNRTLELALSRRSFQWRLEAWRTGKSFAEVVLLKTLLYRVEQAFLIDRNTGLLLQHARIDAATVQDADMVSSMLTAIRDFARDSFKMADTDSLEALKVGELSVWIEPGPHAMLAAVIRGSAPRDLRRRLQDAVETIHLQFAPVLEAFNGDASTLDGARPTIEECLHTEYRPDERKPRTRGALIVAGLVVLAVALWAGLAYRSNARWGRYLDAIRAEPGLVIVSAERQRGRFVLSGLRDPLARDPATLIAGTGLSPDDVTARWAGYQALDAPLVLARAQDLLKPPAGVTLTLANGVLAATGDVPTAWVAEARQHASFIAGVRTFDAVGSLAGRTRTVVGALESQVLLFVKGAAQMVLGQEPVIRKIVADLTELDALASATGQRFTVELIGHTDADGPDASNVPLSNARAQIVRIRLPFGTLTRLQATTSGMGSRMPAVESASEDGKEKNRRVVLRITARPDTQ